MQISNSVNECQGYNPMILLEKNQRVNIVGSKKILVVDDEEVIREIVQNCLEDLAGWNVITATSGQEALNKVITEEPDAIILDVMMPGINGLKFLRLLKENFVNYSIPVILLTAKLEFTNPRQLSNLDLAGVISKPFDPYELVEKIAEMLNWELEN